MDGAYSATPYLADAHTFPSGQLRGASRSNRPSGWRVFEMPQGVDRPTLSISVNSKETWKHLQLIDEGDIFVPHQGNCGDSLCGLVRIIGAHGKRANTKHSLHSH